MLIDMKVEMMKLVKSTTARFQRNRDGQYVGKLIFGGEGQEPVFDAVDCWLVFEHSASEPDTLKLSFDNPYPALVRKVSAMKTINTKSPITGKITVYEVREIEGKEAIMVQRTSIGSGKTNQMELPITPQRFLDYCASENPVLVQDAFPDLTDEQREFIMTGITQEEWDEGCCLTCLDGSSAPSQKAKKRSE
jgi:hypothetical protein